MKTFQQFVEQAYPKSYYTDTKAPEVQATHIKNMAAASKLRQSGTDAVGWDPKEVADANKRVMTGTTEPGEYSNVLTPLRWKGSRELRQKPGGSVLFGNPYDKKVTEQYKEKDGMIISPDGKSRIRSFPVPNPDPNDPMVIDRIKTPRQRYIQNYRKGGSLA